MEDARLASIDVSDTRPSEATALDHGGHVDDGAALEVVTPVEPVSNTGPAQPTEQPAVQAPVPGVSHAVVQATVAPDAHGESSSASPSQSSSTWSQVVSVVAGGRRGSQTGMPWEQIELRVQRPTPHW